MMRWPAEVREVMWLPSVDWGCLGTVVIVVCIAAGIVIVVGLMGKGPTPRPPAAGATKGRKDGEDDD